VNETVLRKYSQSMRRGALVNYEHVVDSAWNTGLNVAEAGGFSKFASPGHALLLRWRP
jgi:hypothetical protein